MAKGHKTGGRTKGTLNKATVTERGFFHGVLPDATEQKLWAYFTGEDQPVEIRLKAFLKAVEYKRGKPVQPVGQAAPIQAEPITLKVEHIGASAEFFANQAAILGLK